MNTEGTGETIHRSDRVRVYHAADEIDFRLSDLPRIEPRGKVLMTTPEHFDVRYIINPHMAGNIGTVDSTRARSQWEDLKSSYESLGMVVDTVSGLSGLPDMVFCANQTLPWPVPYSRGYGVVLSNMYSKQRQPEVQTYAVFFEQIGYSAIVLPDPSDEFEGMGDALWHEGRRVLWGGYGFRTCRNVYTFLSERMECPVMLLELKDPDFYHLDTCLSILDEDTALIYPGAFAPEGLELIRSLFARVIEAPEKESRELFACNAHCPDGNHVLIQEGCDVTESLLSEAGFLPIALDTSEYLKAGGSVFCMKQMFW